MLGELADGGDVAPLGPCGQPSELHILQHPLTSGRHAVSPSGEREVKEPLPEGDLHARADEGETPTGRKELRIYPPKADLVKHRLAADGGMVMMSRRG
jgi:hypothetical protein